MELNLEIFKELLKAYKEGKSKFIELFDKLSLEEKVKLFVQNPDLVLNFLDKNPFVLECSNSESRELFSEYITSNPLFERYRDYDLKYFLENERRFYNEKLEFLEEEQTSISDLGQQEQIKEILYSNEINALIIREMLISNTSSFINDW